MSVNTLKGACTSMSKPEMQRQEGVSPTPGLSPPSPEQAQSLLLKAQPLGLGGIGRVQGETLFPLWVDCGRPWKCPHVPTE